jgi:hypothetical protein
MTEVPERDDHSRRIALAETPIRRRKRLRQDLQGAIHRGLRGLTGENAAD